jgi:hypothetical protein
MYVICASTTSAAPFLTEFTLVDQCWCRSGFDNPVWSRQPVLIQGHYFRAPTTFCALVAQRRPTVRWAEVYTKCPRFYLDRRRGGGKILDADEKLASLRIPQ